MKTADLNVHRPSPKTILRQPPQPMTMVLGSPLSQRSALPDLENLFGDATFQAQSTTQTNTRSSQRIMPTGTNNMPLTYIHQPTVADPRPTNTHSDDENLGSLYQGLPRDAKIGIIISIVVIVSLSLLGCGMCFLDCRRRQRKRKERRDTHEAELMMLEMEIRNGHREQQKCARKGLWDHLKPASGNEAAISTEVTRADAATKSDSLYGRNDSAVGSTGIDNVASRSPVLPQDRVSIVSSIPSVISSAGVRPALPQSHLASGSLGR